MNIAIDIYVGVPGFSAVIGTRNASHMDVSKQYAPVRVGRDRANAQRWPETLAIHDCRARKPGIAPHDVVEAINRTERTAPSAQPQHACIVRSYIDGVSNNHTARKFELARSDGRPFAAWCAPQQRMLPNNGKRTAASVRCESSDGLVRKLMRAPIAGDCEQPIGPGCHKYRRFRHGSDFAVPATYLTAALATEIGGAGRNRNEDSGS